MSSNTSLNPLTFPLVGTRLIEASAGTGKTYTIAALYVRLILGHGNDKTLPTRELFPPDILVVTFTEAATKELRDRIRSRLSQAARYFGKVSDACDDFLEQLRASYPDSEWPACAHRLKLAADWMDEAAIYTIHGWCNRMLQQHAFDSGNLFRQEVNNDDQELLNEVVRDYWRIFYYRLTETQCLTVLKLADSPVTLATKIKPLLPEAEAMGLTRPDDEDLATVFRVWEEWALQYRTLEQAARMLWHEYKEEIEQRLISAIDNRWLNGNQYRPAIINLKLQELALWAKSGQLQNNGTVEKFCQQNLLTGLVKAHQDKAEQIQHQAFRAIDTLIDHARQEPETNKTLLLHAVNWIRNRYDQLKIRSARITFDDMLTRLDAALQSSNGKQLVPIIQQQFPIALFDEFQDTDPIQYRIISTIYPVGQTTDLGCFMIGDPKQAIYSFRGADIFTYLKAYRATIGNHYTLSVNYRSTKTLVNAVNQFFLQADEQAEGAFRFKTDQDNPLPYIKVSAKGRDDEWVVDDKTLPALNLWHWDSAVPVGMPEYRQTMAEITASEIVRLLNKTKQGNTGFKNPSGTIKPIQPSDFAILVRSGTEAKIMRSALTNRQIRSVYLSERDSIYATCEAADILIWLKAIADPRNERKIRTALSTATLGWDYHQIQQLSVDEPGWEQHVERFLGYHQRWQQDGILPTLRQFINDYCLTHHLYVSNNGERCLTNLLHLAELLQHASANLEGTQALIRHFSEEIAASEQMAEQNVIRLESDANLIKIITIHKSKGLEYPLVFMPFICSFREVNNRNPFYRYHDADQKLCIDLDLSDENKALSDKERLQEDIRLLYVAMTRAQFACWLGIAAVKNGNVKDCQLEKSGIGSVLGWAAKTSCNDLTGNLDRVKGDCDSILVTPPPIPCPDLYYPSEQLDQLDKPQRSTIRITDNWWIASYSALQTQKKYNVPINPENLPNEPETAQEDNQRDETGIAFASITATLSGIHSLPRGANPGVLVHALLEQCAYFGFQTVHSSPELVEQLISKIFNHKAWNEKHNILAKALLQWLTMPLLAAGNCCLVGLACDQYQAEMEFLLGAENVDVTELDQLVCKHTFAGKPRPSLMKAQIHGLLKGFIDLVFSHDDRYFVVDYKFNALGDNDASYTPENLEAAMLEKRYDMQYALYLLALHRLLKVRLGTEYDYDRHIGGALYLFLRGANTPTSGQVFEKPPQHLIEALDNLFSGQVIKGNGL
jgi:exodeoxyribonuclease V beta subunit